MTARPDVAAAIEMGGLRTTFTIRARQITARRQENRVVIII
jgi:hypothetical protein